MKKFIYSKPFIIASSIILIAFIIYLYTKARTNYPIAILGSLNDSNKYIVNLDINKKIIIKKTAGFKLDNNITQVIVSSDKKYLVYTQSTNYLYNETYIKNLNDGKLNKIIKHNKTSNIRNIELIDKNTLLYLEGNILYTLDLNSMKSKAVELSGNSIKLAAIYYPENKGFIVCINNQDKLNSQINSENDLYMFDSKGGNEKLLKKFTDIYITSMILIPKTENLLIRVANRSAVQSQFQYSDIYLYNIKSGNFKLILKHINDSSALGVIPAINNIFPYNENNFLYQYKYKLYNVNVQTGKAEEFIFKNQKSDEYLYSFIGAE